MADAPVGEGRDNGTGREAEESSTPPGPPRIPVTEVPELEPDDETNDGEPGDDLGEDEADEPAAGSGQDGEDADESGAEESALAFAETSFALPKTAGSAESESSDEAAAAVPAEPAAPLEPAAEAADREAEARRVALAEVEETTLIPKVVDAKPVETTTVMPPVPPASDMARRPYSDSTAAGTSNAARRAYRAAERQRPDSRVAGVPPQGYGRATDATQAWTAPPGAERAEARAEPNGRGYRPPEFREVDPQRAELPPPHNFQLDQREIDGDDGRPRSMVRRGLLVTGGLAVVAAAGLTAAGILKVPGTTPAVPTVGFSPEAESGSSAATQTGTAFLTAWQGGQLAQAANLTDNATAALAALKEYKQVLGVSGMVVSPNPANDVGWMTYSVTTQAGTPMGEWQYSSGFATYSKQIDGYTRWFVKWDPSILYTSLKAGYKLAIRKTPASIKGLVDRNGAAIEASAHPSLAVIITALTKSAEAAGGTAGQDIIMTDAKGNQLATVTTLTPPIDNGTVTTTLDMNVQAAAESAVPRHSFSSIVAIKPSSGHILAVANNTTSQYYDDALLTRVAPGSTFKIVTSTALLSKGLTTLDSTVDCPATITIDQQVLKNSEGEAGANTYEVDFATSCNNAFSSFWDHSGMTGDLLADTAQTYYGLNQAWDIGLGQTATYMDIPKGLSRGGLAESLVGQGDVVACPLAMCSVAATVANGSFKQPILLPTQKQLTATPLGSSLQGQLKTLMASVITEGTAKTVAFPKNGHFFAKTGTAEVGSGADLTNNSWFVVFDDQHDIAVCALSIDGGYGAATAAPECLTVFQKLGYA